MFSIEEKNLMKPLPAYDLFLSDASRRGLNPDAFSREQFWSKLWCIDSVKKAYGNTFNDIYILGGWYGTLAGLLLQDSSIKVKKIFNLDLDENALLESKKLVQDPRYEARHGNLNDLIAQSTSLKPNDLLICLICEHMENLKVFNQLKPGIPIVFQSTNLQCNDHINTKNNLEELKNDIKQIKNFQEKWSGTLDLKWFQRFMVIGEVQRPQGFNAFLNKLLN